MPGTLFSPLLKSILYWEETRKMSKEVHKKISTRNDYRELRERNVIESNWVASLKR